MFGFVPARRKRHFWYGNKGLTFESFVSKLNPLFWLDMREQVGSIADNRAYPRTPGPNLVTNGTFDANIDGWTSSSGATISWVSGRLKVETPTGGTRRVSHTIASGIEPNGGRYVLRFDSQVVSTDGDLYLRVHNENGTGGADLQVTWATVNDASGLTLAYETEFLMGAGNTALFIEFYANTNVISEFYIDNVHLGLVEVPAAGAPELFTNPGEPFTFTADDPDSWTVIETGTDPEISEVASGEAHADAPTPGGGHINFYTSSGITAVQQTVGTIGDTYVPSIDIDRVVSGSIAVGNSGASFGPQVALSTAERHQREVIASATTIGYRRINTPTDITIQSMGLKKLGELDGFIAGTTTLGSAGIRGQASGELGRELLSNSDLESWVGASDLTTWSENVSGTSTVNQETINPHSGTYCARLDIDGLNSPAAIVQAVTIAAGSFAEISGWVRASNISNTPNAHALVAGVEQFNIPLTTEWTYFTGLAYFAAANGTVSYRRDENCQGISIYFDDLSVRRYNVPHAMLFDGATSLITVYNRTALQAIPQLSYATIFRSTGTGEGSAGRFIDKSGNIQVRYNGSAFIVATVNYSTTSAVSVSNVAVSHNLWNSLVVTHDGLVNRIYLNGVETGYSQQDQAVGTRTNNANDIIIGNNSTAANTFAGLKDEDGLIGRVMTLNEIRLFHTLGLEVPVGSAASSPGVAA